MRTPKIKIYSVHDKEPSFIRLQHRTFQQFIKDEYEFIVCDNAQRKSDSRKIRCLCTSLGLRYQEIPEQHHENPNIACSYPLDYLMQKFIANETESQHLFLLIRICFL